MEPLVVAKFGGSAIGPYGRSVPAVLGRISDLKRGSRVVAVFSAPLTEEGGRRRSVTDAVIELGESAAAGGPRGLGPVRAAYAELLRDAPAPRRAECAAAAERHLAEASRALDEAAERREFADEARARALGHAGELLMAELMHHAAAGAGHRSAAVQFSEWPIVTDGNWESANFLLSESEARAGALERLVAGSEVVCIGGFVGRTASGSMTTYERGGSDRTAADVGLLLRRKYDVRIDFEKDGMVSSADPATVSEGLEPVRQLSYNEARTAGMFGMKILDPVAIKEVLEHGVDMPMAVTDMGRPESSTAVLRSPPGRGGHPVKIVTGKPDCAIFRTESEAAGRLLASLERDRRYSEYVVLSPYARDGTEFSRVLFLDAGFVRRNEKYLLGFDPLASATYGRGVVTLIGDEMWRVRQVVSKVGARLGAAGINILNMDAQEETSRIIIVIDDGGDAVARAVRAAHAVRAEIGPE